mmetsp:Transcript_12720/g.19183  ORF Transcript_12720/g.19183 Transcript_12720/m.19183 type:complete len:114 (-) Transcript_12720:957-1298(-)
MQHPSSSIIDNKPSPTHSNNINVHSQTLIPLTLLTAHKLVNNGVEEDSSNTDSASKQLHGVEGLSKHNGDSNDDNYSLGGVSDRLGDSAGLLQCHSGELVVSVEPQTRSKQVE